DGSVVLQAEQTQWKVHWTVLALHSSFFRDMQAQTHPPKPSDIDGCPVIELSEDAQDVEDVLKALYIPYKILPLPVVRAFIRLGRKYDFKDLLKSAVTRIMSEAPTTLEEYDAMDDTIGFRSFEDFNGLELDLIILASENNLRSALPCLYYRAVQLWSPVSNTKVGKLSLSHCFDREGSSTKLRQRTEHLFLCSGRFAPMPRRSPKPWLTCQTLK
ncbi:hypothetical protein B0H14DRAFT_2365013, partial [Mycena olivaceomarginata]